MSNRHILVGLGVLTAILGILVHRYVIEQDTKARPSNMLVTASFYPLYFFASEVGGDKASVSNVTPAGVEPHEYEPTARDIALIERSDIILLNGKGFETWGDSVRKSADARRARVIALGEGLATQKIIEDGKEIADPHVWLSPRLARGMVEEIAAAFERADPLNALYYRANAKGLMARLDLLDKEYARVLDSCEDRDIVTSHAAFGYLASTYGLRQVPIAGLSPEAEPSPREIARIAEFAKKNGIRYIFFESLASPKLAETVAVEIGAETLVLDPIEGLGADERALGKTYFTEMESNLGNLVTALQCAQ